MRKLATLFSLLAMIISVAAIAQNDDDWESKDYNPGNYDEIYLEGGFKVYLIQGDECNFTAKSTDDDVFDDLIVRNENGRLFVKMDRNFFHYDRVTLYFTFENLERLEIEGGANLSTRGYIDMKDFWMYWEGVAKIELNIKADN